MANLVRWDPFSEFTTLRQAMDRLFEDAWVRPSTSWANAHSGQGSVFAFDLYETGDDYIVTATLPGVKPDELDISVQGNLLTIAGELKSEDGDGERNYHLRERSYGRFSRQVTLPMGVQPDQIHAQMEHGVLTMRLPKAEEAKPRRIQIQARTGTPQIVQPTVEEQAA